MSSHFLYMMWNARWLWIQWRGNVLHLELIWGTPIYFAFLMCYQCFSLVVTGFLGILFSSIREIGFLYVFDWEQGTPQHAMKWNRSSSCMQREVSWIFKSWLHQAPGVYSRVTAEMAIWNSGLSREVRTPVELWRTPRELKLGLAGKYGRFCGWAGRPSVPY